MSTQIWLDPGDPFPEPHCALPQGLLAVGGDLSLASLTKAYRRGIFPWFNPGDPILWWSPDPRMLLQTANLHLSRSLAKLLRQMARREAAGAGPVQVTMNTCFDAVIQACAGPRQPGGQTWISPHMQHAYTQWHRAGGAHSIEVWHGDELVGGLYGVAQGRFFFGESMFSRRDNASKIALAYLTRFLQCHGVQWIDCQQETRHLASMGARPVSRDFFLQELTKAVTLPGIPWTRGVLRSNGSVAPTPELHHAPGAAS